MGEAPFHIKPAAQAAVVTAATPRRLLFASFGIRVLSSSLLIAAVAAGVCAPAGFFVLIMTVFIGGGLWEYFNLLERKGLYAFRWAGLLIGCSIPAVTWFAAGTATDGWIREGVALWLLAGALALCVIQFVRRASRDALSTVACTVFGVLYVAWLLSFLVRLKLLPHGTALVGFVVVVTKAGDMGAYLVGAALGRTPLIPRISPKKTVEGLVGGLVASLAIAVALQSWLPRPAWSHAVILGLLLGGGAQAGDLIESLFKRDCETKDSGRAVPGLGGVLDVIDSLLFTVPVFYAYVRIVWFS